MADDPWAAFNPQPAPTAAPTAVIPDTPAPQTPAQATKDSAEAEVVNATAPAVIATKQAEAKSAQYKATQDDLATAKQQLEKWGGAEQIDHLVNAVERAKALVGDTTTGAAGSIFQHIPSTDAYDLDKIITQEVRGNVFLQRIQALKEENPSPNGGTGIGRIMQAEIPMITGAGGALDIGMKGSALTQSLNQIELGALRTKAKLAGENPDDPAVQKQYGIDKLIAALPPGSSGTPGSTPSGTTPPGMSHFTVKSPDGKTYEFDAPANATPEQLDAMTRAAAGAPKNYPVKDGGIGSQLVGNTVNDVAGVAQGAAALPDLAAKGVGKVMSAVPSAVGYGLDALGFPNAAKSAYGIAHDLANPPQIGNAIESIAPTPNTTSGRVNRIIGNVVGATAAFPQSAAENVISRFVGEAPKGPGPLKGYSPDIVQDAAQNNVPLLTSDVKPPQTFIGKAAQAIGERIPITGTGTLRASQQAARVEAIKSAAQDFGAATGDELNSPAIDSVAQDLAKQRSAQLTRLTNQKNSVINGVQGVVPVDSAVAATNQEIAKLQSTGLNAYAPVIAKLNDWKQAIQGKDLQTVEMLRRQIGQDFTAPDLASVRDVADKALSNIYGPLRDDMGSFIKANGSPGDFNKWQSANDQLSGMVGDLKNTALKKSLATADTTPENVASLLFSSKPSDVRTLYAGLSPVGRAKAQAAIVQRAVEKAGGMDSLSPEKFATQIKSLGNQVGVFFNGDDAARLQGLQRVLQATQRASQAAVSPPTGVQAVPYAMGAGFSEMFGIPGGVTAALGTGLLARAYESAPVRNLLLKLGQSKPGTQQERFIMGRLGSAINAAVQKPSAVPTALNENMPQMGSAAASPNSGPNQQQ